MTLSIKSASFSLIKRYEKCPYEVYLDRGAREPKPVRGDDHPLNKGLVAHKEVENYIKGEGPLTAIMKHRIDLIDKYKELYASGAVECEPEWYFNEEWKVVDKGSHTFVIKPDLFFKAGNNADLCDWKTGKSFAKEVSHGEQTQLYSIGAFLRYGDLTAVRAAPVYLEEKGSEPRFRPLLRPMIATLLPRWQRRIERLFNEQQWKPKPNRSNCKYCDYGTANGNGKCPYSVEA
jgi:hypothetical protein